jgi:hypothetical protein
MDLFELTHKKTAYHTSGFKIDIAVVGRGGRVWSIEEAGRLILSNQAKFFHGGKEATSLDMIPEGPDASLSPHS